MTFNYILIFVSTGLFCYILIRMVTKYLQEKLELNTNKKYEALRRFVSPEKLLLSRKQLPTSNPQKPESQKSRTQSDLRL